MTDVQQGPPSSDSPWPVSRLARELKGWIDRLGTVWIEGELTQWNLRGSGVFGKLKDLEQDVTVDIRLWRNTLTRLTEEFAPGDRVVANVKADYWMGGGSLTMVVNELRHAGLGELLERLERLRRTLAAEGLFDAERKRPLPFLPRCIGLITGKDSDAEKDVLRNAQLRWPQVRFRTIHTPVQGERAAAEVTAALRTLDADPEVDVIIVARGGGDFQNLLPFSDEELVRTAAACATPVVSAIGHEADRPLLDEVADLRASTPTDAAKRVVPDVQDELQRIAQARVRLTGRVTSLLAHELETLGQLRSRPALADPRWIVDVRAEALTHQIARGTEVMDRALERAGASVDQLRGRLRGLSPLGTLERGYAIVQNDKGVVTTPTDAEPGRALTITVAGGSFGATSTGGRG